MPTPRISPWGDIQHQDTLCDGAFQVSTAGHGGVMILQIRADKFLSPEAQACGFQYGPWLCFEEDCDAPVAILELLDKGLYQAPVNEYYAAGEYRAAIERGVEAYHKEYWVRYSKPIQISLRTMTKPEQMYCYSQSQQISMQTGFIGYLRADMDSNGQGFFSSFNTFRADLKTEDFKTEFDDVINALRSDERYGGILRNRTALSSYCWKHPEAGLDTDGRYYGIRADTDHYSYMLRLTPYKGEYNLYCYCYLRQWLDRHMEQAEKGIRFIDPNYKELFRIPDGDKIRIDLKNGEHREQVCRYIDETHMELSGGYDSPLYHICEFAERIRDAGSTVVPLRSSLPEQCYSNLLDTGAVVILKKGETGYYKTDILFTDRESAIALVEEYNGNLGITMPQFEAMKAGSMFGFHVQAADPKNYDDQGQPIRPKHKDRGDAR